MSKNIYEDFFTGDSAALYNYIKSKKSKLHFDYDEIMHSAHHKAFTVAKVTKLDLLKDIQDSLVRAKKNGTKFEEWKKQIKPTLAKKGWLGEVELTNPKTGEVKKIYVGNRRLKTIYSTNMSVARAKANWDDAIASDMPYLRYVAILDNLVRPEHAKHHGVILPINHPFWDTHYPPNAWNCRCKAQSLDENIMKKRGWSVSKDVPEAFASADWSYNVGKTDNIDKVWDKKIQALDSNCTEYNSIEVNASAKKPCLKALNKKAKLEKIRAKKEAFKTVAKKQLNEMIDEVIVKNNVKYPLEIIQVGIIANIIAGQAKKFLDIDIEDRGILLTKERLTHSSPKRKDKYGHSFEIEEMKQIVDVLDNIDFAYIDTRDKKNNLLFIFDDIKNNNKINLIPIDLKKILKKFKKTNFILTLDKNNKKEIERLIKKGIIVKVK